MKYRHKAYRAEFEFYITTNAVDKLHPRDVIVALGRHLSKDWGDASVDDKRANDEAVKNGGRLFSVYHDCNKTKFWLITEADRSVTTVLLPEDY